MDKSKFNFIIDALMFFCLMAIAGLGFLQRYVLIPGQERWAKYGRNVDLTWWGWDRHDWGQIHLYLGFILLGLLTIHTILHWHMILGLFNRLIPEARTRTRVAYIFLGICLVLFSFAFLVSPKVTEIKPGQGRQVGGLNLPGEKPASASAAKAPESSSHPKGNVEVRGYMTLGEVSQKYSVPIGYLREKLSLPPQVGPQDRMSVLKDRHGFSMSQVEKIITEYKP